MFDYKLMTESADEIEIMEYSADFDYSMSIHEIAYMESGDVEVFIESVIETAKEYIIKIYVKIRKAIMDVKAKITTKVNDAKLKIAMKKWQALNLADRTKFGSKKIKIADLGKIMKTLDQHSKMLYEYYKWVENYDLTEENADDFLEKARGYERKHADFVNSMNSDEFVYWCDVQTCLEMHTELNTIITNKWEDAVSKAADRDEKTAKEAVDKVVKKAKSDNDKKLISRQTSAITKRAAKTASYYAAMTGLILASVHNFDIIARQLSTSSSPKDLIKERPTIGGTSIPTAARMGIAAATTAGAKILHDKRKESKKNEEE